LYTVYNLAHFSLRFPQKLDKLPMIPEKKHWLNIGMDFFTKYPKLNYIQWDLGKKTLREKPPRKKPPEKNATREKCHPEKCHPEKCHLEK